MMMMMRGGVMMMAARGRGADERGQPFGNEPGETERWRRRKKMAKFVFLLALVGLVLVRPGVLANKIHGSMGLRGERAAPGDHFGFHGSYNKIPGDPGAHVPVVWQMPHPDQLPGASVGPTFYPRPLPGPNVDVLHPDSQEKVWTGPPGGGQTSTTFPGPGNYGHFSPRNLPPSAAARAKKSKASLERRR